MNSTYEYPVLHVMKQSQGEGVGDVWPGPGPQKGFCSGLSTLCGRATCGQSSGPDSPATALLLLHWGVVNQTMLMAFLV